jgi:2-oxoisovalerate dehydrogenase E1 component
MGSKKKKDSVRSGPKIRTPLSRDRLSNLLEGMILIRFFEKRAKGLFQEGKLKGTAHPCIGQEAIAVGSCAALDPKDYIVSNHRGHGHCLARGASIPHMMAELLGRDGGYCRGLGGSMHIAALELNILGANGIVGAGMGLGTGAALSAHLRHSGQIALIIFGDGASNEGIFHESLNLAALWRLPAVFLCENNQYGLTTSIHESTAGADVSARAAGYGIPGVRIDGNDVMAVYEAVMKAGHRARRGLGPTLIEALTYRWEDHSMRANLPPYRTENEIRQWQSKDPIARLAEDLLEKGLLSLDDIDRIKLRAKEELERAVSFAEGSAEPSADLLQTCVYAPFSSVSEPGEASAGGRTLTYIEALREAMEQEMERDSSVFIIGEDVGKTGGIFGVTRGLRDRFGPSRLLDTPISEGAIAGAGVGAAITGMRPIVEVQIFDFVTLMMDMIANQAAKFRFMLGGRPTVPIVFRGPQGGGVSLSAQHSQSLEAWFTHVPRLVVVAPSTPYDAKGLLASSIRDDNPIVFIEHKLLYLGQPGPVPEEPYLIPLGKADIKKTGRDVTVLATMHMVGVALTAALRLEEEGISVEVIDPRSLKPLDEEAILASVRKTNRLIVAHEACMWGGFGAEVAALVQEKAFDHLDAPIVRVAAADVPIPYNRQLESLVIPGQRQIMEAVRSVCYR